MTAAAHTHLFTQHHPADLESGVDSDVHCLFLHGWGMNSLAWAPVLSGLNHIHRHTMDLCGHGCSEALPLPKDANGNLILDAWLDAIEPHLPSSPFYVCGWSLGGLVSLAIAKRWGGRIKGISLIASAPCFTQQANWPAPPKQNIRDFSNALTDNPISTLRAFIALQFLGSHNHRGKLLSTLKNIRSHGKADVLGLHHGLNILMDVDLRDAYAQLNVPCQILLGAHDTLIPNTLSPQLNQLNPNTTLTSLEDAGHAPLFTHTHIVTDWLQGFIRA